MKKSYKFDGKVILWIKSYLKEMTSAVIINCFQVKMNKLLYGAPQGLILGPLFFAMHISELKNFAEKCDMQIQIYADDTNFYLKFAPGRYFTQAGQSIASCLRGLTVHSQAFLEIEF